MENVSKQEKPQNLLNTESVQKQEKWPNSLNTEIMTFADRQTAPIIYKSLSSPSHSSTTTGAPAWSSSEPERSWGGRRRLFWVRFIFKMHCNDEEKDFDLMMMMMINMMTMMLIMMMTIYELNTGFASDVTSAPTRRPIKSLGGIMWVHQEIIIVIINDHHYEQHHTASWSPYIIYPKFFLSTQGADCILLPKITLSYQGLAIYPRPGDGKIISNQSLVLQKVRKDINGKKRLLSGIGGGGLPTPDFLLFTRGYVRERAQLTFVSFFPLLLIFP